MEFLLILGCGVLLIILLQRTGNTATELEALRRSLDIVSDRLDQVLRNRPVAPAAAPTEPAEQKIEIIRMPVVETPPPAPEPPPPPPAPEPVRSTVPVVPPTPEPESIPAAASVSAEDTATAEPPPPPPRSQGPDFGDLEKRFGTQWVVWVGGIALALGGIFLVRYSIEAGLFGPKLRVFFGAVLAAALVGLGELARRREIISGLDKLPTAAHIPSILTAAGTTCAYADVWAAYALYGFLSSAMAFVLLGAVALGTLAAALRHGPALGGLGLVGAYVTPILVSSHEPNYWALYIYLAVVTAAAYALARIRMWRWLAITAAVFSILWMLVGIGDPRGGSLSAHCFYALVSYALAAYFIVAGLFQGPPAERGRFDPVSCGVLAGYLFGAFMLVVATKHDGMTMATIFALMAATVAIAWRTEAAILAMPAAAFFGVLVVLYWAVDWWFVIMVSPGGPWANSGWQMQVVGTGAHATFALATAALFGAGGYLGQDRTERTAFSMLWAATAVITAVALLILVYYRVTQFERSIPFAGIALVLAGLCAAATELLWKREPRPGFSEAGAIFATGAVAGLALTLTFALERGWLTVGLSLMAPGIAWIADKRPVPLLRKLCGVIAALVLARIGWDPRIVGDAVGTTPIFNWLLWGYGVPAVSFWVAGYILRKRGDDVSSRSIDSAAILFTALLAFLEIRHLMNDGDIYRPSARLGELGLQVSTGLAMAIGLERLRERSQSVIHDWASRIFGALAFVSIVFGLLIRENPMITGEPVGGIFWNYLLLGYAIPAVLAGILARVIKTTRPQAFYLTAAITSIVLMLVYLTLEVRTIFQGAVLKGGIMSDAEDYTYSAVWLAFGVALLAAGILLKSQPARLASAAVVILTIAKVFLHDLAGVHGIFRALSFIGLGLVLMGIGWLYQRLLFPPRLPGNAEAAGSSPAA